MQTLTVPPMAEGIDTHDGQVYLANESASNLYLLGKFFGGSYVYAFPTPLGNAPNPPIYPYILEALPKTKRIVTAPQKRAQQACLL